MGVHYYFYYFIFLQERKQGKLSDRGGNLIYGCPLLFLLFYFLAGKKAG